MEYIYAVIFIYLIKLSITIWLDFSSQDFATRIKGKKNRIEKDTLISEALQSDDAKVYAIKNMALQLLQKSENNETKIQQNVGWRERSAMNNAWKDERRYILAKARLANLLPETKEENLIKQLFSSTPIKEDKS